MWSHLEMVKAYCGTYAWGTFAQFEREYAKRVWTQDEHFPESHFGPCDNNAMNHHSMIHAGIIKFDDVGMLLGPWSYFQFTQWEAAHTCKAPSKLVDGPWDKE